MSVRKFLCTAVPTLALGFGLVAFTGCHKDDDGKMHMGMGHHDNMDMSKHDMMEKGDSMMMKGQDMKSKGMQMNDSKMQMDGQNMMDKGQMMKDKAMKM